MASLAAARPGFVSIPMDDWDAEADRIAPAARSAHASRDERAPIRRSATCRMLAAAANPVLVAGPEVDASGGWDAAVALAEKQRLPVWSTPAVGGSRIGFPEAHPNFVGVLPPAIGAISETLKPYDLVLVVGSAVFPYYPYFPGPLLAEGTSLIAINGDPVEAARAPMGDAIVGDVALALEALVELVGPPSGPRPTLARPRPSRPRSR